MLSLFIITLYSCYKELIKLWNELIPETTDTEMKSQKIRVRSMMQKIFFLSGCLLRTRVLNHTNNFSRVYSVLRCLPLKLIVVQRLFLQPLGKNGPTRNLIFFGRKRIVVNRNFISRMFNYVGSESI